MQGYDYMYIVAGLLIAITKNANKPRKFHKQMYVHEYECISIRLSCHIIVFDLSLATVLKTLQNMDNASLKISSLKFSFNN